MLHKLFTQITEAEHRCAGNRNRITKTEVIEFIHIRHELLKAIHLVNRKNDRLAASSEHVRHLRIGVNKTLAYIHQKHNNIRRSNGNLCLLTHVTKHHVFALRLNTAGIHHGK